MSDASYFLNRELQELRLAEQAINPRVQLVHLTMARKYSERAMAELGVPAKPEVASAHQRLTR
jgi:hypothetical protein